MKNSYTRIGWLLSATVAVFFSIDLSAQPAPGKYTAQLNEMKMYYEVHGQGDPLVLLHCYSASSQLWTPMRDNLSEKYLLVVPDLRGHGRSTNPSGEYSQRQSSLDIFALLDHLEIRSFKAMGISSGGMTLMHMATQQPRRIEAMVLIGAAHYYPKQAREIMEQSTVESLTEEDYERLRQIHLLGDDQIRAMKYQFFKMKDSYDDMNFTPPYLSTITARTLIVHGDRDRFFPVSIPVELYLAIPQSYLWIVPIGGHIPIFGENKNVFVKTAMEFLDGAWEQEE